ncbi:MAG: FKBP-type peptidyl-prolyl cis-trans isomerase [Candidatus Aenigmarchaeota archaeon]|nr:FKBP-type peptidyl-prolyl cis-trans isomerase [Candidatus Aenigmarchaeota archaeon]
MAKRKKEPLPGLKGVAIFVVIGLFLLGLFFVFPLKKAVVPVPELPEKQVIDPNAAQQGDLVSINYVLKLEDGEVVDANGETAKKAGLKTYIAGPFSFLLGKSGKVKGFDEAIIGMLPGAEKTVTIAPSEPVTRVVINRTQPFFRNEPISRISFFPIKKFKELFSKPPIINDVVWNPDFPYKLQVLNFSNKTVVAQAMVKEGDSIQLPAMPWRSKVLSVYDKIITIMHNPETGMFINTLFGNASVSVERSRYFVHYNASVGQLVNYGAPSTASNGLVIKHAFKVTEMTNETITIVRDDNLAEKKLTLELSLVELRKS